MVDLILGSLLVLSVLGIGVEWHHRRSGGTRPVVISVANAAIIGSAFVGNRSNQLRYALLATGVALFLSLMATARRGWWRPVRLELSLLGTAALLIAILTLFADRMPRGIVLVSLGLLAVFTGTGIVVGLRNVALRKSDG